MFAPPVAHSAGPSAPPASMFDSVPGYEGTVAGGGTLITKLSVVTSFYLRKSNKTISFIGGFLPPPMPAYPVPEPEPATEQPHWK